MNQTFIHLQINQLSITGSISGIISLNGLFLTLLKSSFISPIAFIVLFILLISFGIIIRTGYWGGQIRHTEINSAASHDNKEENKKIKLEFNSGKK